MAGHSKWSKIKRDKGANDAKRGAIFTKVGNQIAIAARSGTDPALNSVLALAIEKAKSVNMPMANIQRAIDRVNDKAQAQVEEIVYEGYGHGGVAIIVETATDNKNRTYPEVRHAFTKNGGTIAEPGSVAFQFERKGVIVVAKQSDGDAQLLDILEAGASDAQVEDDEVIIYTDMKSLHMVRDKIVAKNMDVKDASLQYVPLNYVSIDDPEDEAKLLKLLDAIDELDDVTNVFHNAS